MPDFQNIFKNVYAWINERLDLEPLVEQAKHKVVPVHRHSFWYYWGGISLFLFLAQLVTGVLLMVYYRPGPDAYLSVHEITNEIEFGWFIRSVHAWSANLMIASVLVHMFSVYFMRAYRKPREFGWWSGLALLGLCMVFGFSGYLLPMDDLAFFATKVGLTLAGSIPGAERIITDIVRGGTEVSQATLQRFFTLHVIVLPALFIPILGFHLWLVQKHGNAVPPSEELKPEAQRPSIPFFPNFILKDLAVWLVTLNVLSVMAALFPWGLGTQADPLAPAPVGIHPEWYFMSPFQVLKIFGRWFPGVTGELAGNLLFTVGIVLWALIPLYDIRGAKGQRARWVTYFGILIVVGLAATTILAYFDLG